MSITSSIMHNFSFNMKLKIYCAKNLICFPSGFLGYEVRNLATEVRIRDDCWHLGNTLELN